MMYSKTLPSFVLIRSHLNAHQRRKKKKSKRRKWLSSLTNNVSPDNSNHLKFNSSSYICHHFWEDRDECEWTYPEQDQIAEILLRNHPTTVEEQPFCHDNRNYHKPSNIDSAARRQATLLCESTEFMRKPGHIKKHELVKSNKISNIYFQ